MSSEIKVSNVKAKDGTAGISIADSTGNVSLSGTLSAGTLGSSVVGGNMAVGSVTESSGTPTGDIIQRSSNSNGEYVRYADGTQICTFYEDYIDIGSDVSTYSHTWTFPVSFNSDPSFAGTTGGALQSGTWKSLIVGLHGTGPLTTTDVDVKIMGHNGASFGKIYDMSFLAIGRWF